MEHQCPWCGEVVEPQPTDPFVACWQYKHENMERALRLNPLMCPLCFGVGSEDDFSPTLV